MTIPQGINPLVGIRAKLDRAREHFDSLNAEVRAYLDRGPYEVVTQEYPNFDGRGFDAVAYVLKLREDAPIRLSTILGDCIHNLRSVLDYLAWQLVIAAGNQPRTDPPRTQFPIYAEKPNKSVNIAGGIQPEALTLVRQFQPYTRPNIAKMQPLAVIHELSNRDKHRNLVLATAYALDAVANLRDPKTGNLISRPLNRGFLYNDAVIGWYAKSETHTQVEVEGTTTVSLRELEGYEYVPVQIPIGNALNFLEKDLLPAFAPLIQ